VALIMSPNEIRSSGIKALTQSLGPTGMARFMQQFGNGYGDYTRERGQWLDMLSLEDICQAIENKVQEERVE